MRKRSRKKNADLQADTNLNSLIARMSGKCRKHPCSPILLLVLQQPSEFRPPLPLPQQVARRLPRTCCTYSLRNHNITRTYPNTPSRSHTRLGPNTWRYWKQLMKVSFFKLVTVFWTKLFVGKRGVLTINGMGPQRPTKLRQGCT